MTYEKEDEHICICDRDVHGGATATAAAVAPHGGSGRYLEITIAVAARQR